MNPIRLAFLLLAVSASSASAADAEQSFFTGGNESMRGQLIRLVADAAKFRPVTSKFIVNRCWARQNPIVFMEKLPKDVQRVAYPETFCVGSVAIDRSGERPILDVEVWIDQKHTTLQAVRGFSREASDKSSVVNLPIFEAEVKDRYTIGTAAYVEIHIPFKPNGDAKPAETRLEASAWANYDFGHPYGFNDFVPTTEIEFWPAVHKP